MTNLYTSKVVAQWIGISEARVRQLRQQGILEEKRPGLYDLQESVLRYLNYLRGGAGSNLNEERAALTRAKREAAERENKRREGELLEAKDIERALRNMLLNFRSLLLLIPAKLSPTLASMGGEQGKIYDELRKAIEEALESMSDYKSLLEHSGTENEEEDMSKDADAGDF